MRVSVGRRRPVRTVSFRGVHNCAANYTCRAADGRAGRRVAECRGANSRAKTRSYHTAAQDVLFRSAHTGTAGQE